MHQSIEPRNKAIQTPGYSNVKYNPATLKCMIRDLYQAFTWSDMPEGRTYWTDVLARFENLHKYGTARDPEPSWRDDPVQRKAREDNKGRYREIDNGEPNQDGEPNQSSYYPE